jgi:hypothetical protein
MNGDEAEDEAGQPGYFFDSTGGCELCDAMAGSYEYEPSRPHPNCDCEIEPDQAPQDDGQEPAAIEWEIVSGPEIEFLNLPATWDAEIVFSLECPDGSTNSKTVIYGVQVDAYEDPDSALDRIISAVVDDLDELEAELWRGCLEQPVA